MLTMIQQCYRGSMQVSVRYLDNLRLEAHFDDYKIVSDQPIRYKGDGTAPSPFDYFLASSALCAAYFVKVYCVARDISTDGIRVLQNNIVDPENRYQQIIQLDIELPESISDHDREGILKAMDRCTVKKVIQQNPSFKINAHTSGLQDSRILPDQFFNLEQRTVIAGKDSPLEETFQKMSQLISQIGIRLEISSWRNPAPYVWSVHLRDADAHMCFSNGKGSSQLSALCSALGEFLERMSTNYFYSDYYLGAEIASSKFVHFPSEKWFLPNTQDDIPEGLMDDYLQEIYGLEGELKASHLIDSNGGIKSRGICALPFVRQSNQSLVYVPVNLLANLFASNGMSAGNTILEARVQALSEIFERAVKNQIIREELSLPDVPKEVLSRYPHVEAAIAKLENQGYPILVKDASLGGQFPVINVTLMNPRTGGVFASFGAHPRFEIALERALTELMQGRSYEGLDDVKAPTFNQALVSDDQNIIDHFIDSTGVISWKFFRATADFEFCDWNFFGSTHEEFDHLVGIFRQMNKEVYIADYEDLGVKATRIIVPGYSEIYPIDELVCNNQNQALEFREDILNLHSLSAKKLKLLVKRLETIDTDQFSPVRELIGVAFEESSNWGQLTLIELKAMIYLALGELEECFQLLELMSTFKTQLPERVKFLDLLTIVVELKLKNEKMADYQLALEKIYGHQLVSNVLSSVNGEIKFFGLISTDMNVSGIERHQKLIQSYQKIHHFRANRAGLF